MKQTILDEFNQSDNFSCERCKRRFKSAKALNIHLTKRHVMDAVAPVYAGEGIRDIKSDGGYVDLRLRIKQSLWDGVKKVALCEKIKPEEAVVTALVNLTVYGAKDEKSSSYIS